VGFHIPSGSFHAPTAAWYLRWPDPAQHCLVQAAGRERGLMTARGNPLGLTSLADLERSTVRFVNRQPGSGTRMLLEMMLAANGLRPSAIQGFNTAELTHSAVAAYIASDMADVGFGMRAASSQFKLDFTPMVNEVYYFALRRDAIDVPAMRQLLALMRAPAYPALVAALDGYDARRTGELLSVDEAFSA
jgi:molybdate-binding protein